MRPFFGLFLSILLSVPAAAQSETTGEPAAESRAEPAAEPAEKEAPLPPPVEEAPAKDEAAATEVPTAPLNLQELKDQIKEELRAELEAEMRKELDQRDQESTSEDADGEWKEQRWVEEVKPTLNFLEFDGYFRVRGDLFNRLDLGTYDPEIGRGTSPFPVPTNYRPYDGEEGCAAPANEPNGRPGQFCLGESEDSQNVMSANTRLSLRPTLHISEDIRIMSRIDVFDNLVLGSTPQALSRGMNPQVPISVASLGDNPAQTGFNTAMDAIRLKRLWGEVMTPFGLFRFGRQPQHFGLGILANGGDQLDSDYGDHADQILFATEIGGHQIAPAYGISASGPNARGGGAGTANGNAPFYLPGEAGQRFNLDPSDDVHSFMLSVIKKEDEADLEAKLKAGDWNVDYGFFATYRMQRYDVPNYYQGVTATQNLDLVTDYVNRNANIGVLSAWMQYQWNSIRIELEAAGVVGQIEDTQLTSTGLRASDPQMRVWEENQFVNKPLWLIQGGIALETEFGFLNDSLFVGFDAGVASGDDAPGFGIRPGSNPNPRLGDVDGQQYGSCLERGDAGPDGVARTDDDRCTVRDDNVTNFRFDPDYQIDLILFREILGTVSDAAYIKPHVSYYFTESLGLRGDVIYSNALTDASAPGLTSPLGIEIDATGFYGSQDGFFFMVQGGIFFPFGGLNHARDPNDENLGRPLPGSRPVDPAFLNAQFAYTLQGLAGIEF